MSIQKKVANSLAQEIIALGSSTQQTELTEDILEKMYDMTKLYGRISWEGHKDGKHDD